MSSTIRSTCNNPHARIVLLLDMDCFYAQCERVRLGLDVDVSLALLQWNSVLAVTYPARKFGIQRGDSWDAVALKSPDCWTIHLQVLEIQPKPKSQNTNTATTTTNPSEEDEKVAEEEPGDDDTMDVVQNVEQAYNQIYKLSPEEQTKCIQAERGVRRFHHEGKACLERYRMASMRIFAVVLESLTQRLGGKEHFVLERASIDEFYLDITNYCYSFSSNSSSGCSTEPTAVEQDYKTVVVGGDSNSAPTTDEDDNMQRVWKRAEEVSHWIRTDVATTLGFTMSAGISTNKTMAKLAASYGKPDGQAVLPPAHFEALMNDTKIRKVRNFGGKLGKQVVAQILLQTGHLQGNDPNPNHHFTMGDLRQIPLPALQQHFSVETAQFIFDACRGIDREAVKETTGALVKSITSFKSFPSTAHRQEIQNWLVLMATEVTTRVTKDAARHNRYPKSCTLNYMYDTTTSMTTTPPPKTTTSGKRPNGVTSITRTSQRQTRSVRLIYPPPNNEKKTKAQELVRQAMEKLTSILTQHPLRGVGLSASNFESRGQPPEGVAAIDQFFSKKSKDESSNGNTDTTTKQHQQQQSSSSHRSSQLQLKRRRTDIGTYFAQSQQPSQMESMAPIAREESSQDGGTSRRSNTAPSAPVPTPPAPPSISYSEHHHYPSPSSSQCDKDLELAKHMQASYDRENYVLSSTSNQRNGPAKKKQVRRIDTFFGKR
jgi:nucleotidyltransferase/DNA polymerase involved in DNA repair